MSQGSKTRSRIKRKAQKLAAKRAQKAQYKAWAEAGITKKSRRAQQKQRAEARLAKDFKVVSIKAALERPALGKPPNWVNRKAEKLLNAA